MYELLCVFLLFVSVVSGLIAIKLLFFIEWITVGAPYL